MNIRLIKDRWPDGRAPSNSQTLRIATKGILLASLPKQAYLANTLSVGAGHPSLIAVRCITTGESEDEPK